MKATCIISVLLFIEMLFTCSYRLNKKDMAWQPYKKGDRLIFESNKEETDTIEIKSIEVHTNASDPLAVFPRKVQTLFVMGQHEILELNAEKTGSNIQFKLRLGNNKLKYPSTILFLNDKEIKDIELIEFNHHKDVLKIIAKEFYDNMKDRPFDLRYIYWSKEYGYLGLEFKDEYIWKLKYFVRNEKNIL